MIRVVAPALALWLGIALPLQSAEHTSDASTFVDPRDEQVYSAVELAGLTWMARNLAYASKGSYCYENKPESCRRFGRLYKWEAALAACPSGWHLASELEWQALELAMGMPFDALEERQARGDDAATDVSGKLLQGGDTGFEAESGGWRRPDGTFSSGGEAGAWWTSTEAGLGTAWHRDLRHSRRGVWRSRVDKPYALSVRCVRHHAFEDSEPETPEDGG